VDVARIAGYGLLIAGTVLGSLGGARVPRADWTLALTGMALLVVGALLLRRRPAMGTKAAGTADGPGAPASSVTDRIRELHGHVQGLAREAAGLALPDLRDRLGNLDRDYLRPLGDEAPALLASLGPARFAATFGSYAGAERALHRAWSAATDGHRPEAMTSLELGRRRLAETVETL